jgi:hypothetical protein
MGFIGLSSRNGKLTIVDREFNRNKEQTGYSIEEFSKEVFSCMPESYKQETKQIA